MFKRSGETLEELLEFRFYFWKENLAHFAYFFVLALCLFLLSGILIHELLVSDSSNSRNLQAYAYEEEV